MSCATFGGGVSSSHCAEWDLRRLWLYECACWLVCGAWDMGDGSVGPCVVCPWGRDEWICILVGGDPQCQTLVTVFVAGRRSLWPGGTCCFALGDRSCWPRGRLAHMSLCFATSVCSYNVAVLGVHHGDRQGSELVGSFAAGERTSGALGAETGWLKPQEGVACCIVCSLRRGACQEQKAGMSVTQGQVCSCSVVLHGVHHGDA